MKKKKISEENEKKKIPIWKYILFGLFAISIYLIFLLNGINLIAIYAIPLAGFAIKIIVRLGKKWFGWNLNFLLSDEAKKKASEVIINAEKRGIKEGRKTGQKILGKIKSKWAKKEYQKKTGASKLEAHCAVSVAYGKVAKDNPKIFYNK